MHWRGWKWRKPFPLKVAQPCFANLSEVGLYEQINSVCSQLLKWACLNDRKKSIRYLLLKQITKTVKKGSQYKHICLLLNICSQGMCICFRQNPSLKKQHCFRMSKCSEVPLNYSKLKESCPKHFDVLQIASCFICLYNRLEPFLPYKESHFQTVVKQEKIQLKAQRSQSGHSSWIKTASWFFLSFFLQSVMDGKEVRKCENICRSWTVCRSCCCVNKSINYFAFYLISSYIDLKQQKKVWV